MALNGNTREWEESSADLTNRNGSSPRGVRGGSWLGLASVLVSSSRELTNNPNDPSDRIGFRVAIRVPGPLPLFGLAAGYGWSRRLRKRIKLGKATNSAATSW
jgi:hypothetical protein